MDQSRVGNLTAQRQGFPRAAHETRLKILVLRVRLLYPLNTGGKIRSANLLEELSRENDLILATYRYPEDTDDDVQRTARLCQRLVTVPYTETPKRSARFFLELAANLFQPLPYVVAKYASAEMAETVARLYAVEQPDLVLCDFLQSCPGLNSLRAVPFLLFEHNVEAALFEQLAQRAPHLLSRVYLRLQARRLRRYERTQCRRAHQVIAVSSEDRAAIAAEYGVAGCAVVPTGVDLKYFRPARTPCLANNLVFTGAMDWLANQDAMRFFAAEIFPLIRAEVPDTVMSIVGRNPPAELLKLGEMHGMTVTGTVADIRPYVQPAKVYVVPLRIGSGTRLKLLEAMAMGKAVVSTTLGAEGLNVTPGRNIVLADDPRAFARAVVILLRDAARRAELEQNARTLVERTCGWPQVGQVFEEICRHAAATLREESL